MESINQYVKIKNITDTDIRAARKLKSGNNTIYTANAGETKKLLENNCWTEMLGREAKPITRTFGVVAHAVRVDSIDLAHKEITMEKIRAKNAASISGLEIKLIGWLTNLSPGKKKSLLVIECKTAMQANGAIDEGLAIGAELHQYTLYNAACKQKQCFKYQQYGHIAIHCTNTPACGYCAACHSTKDCKKESAKNCVLCSGPHKTWDPQCEHKKKELKRISIARDNTPCKYEIKQPPAPSITNHFSNPSLPRG